MTKLEIKGKLSDLEGAIAGDAKEFGSSPRALAEQLRFIAMDYLILERDYAASQTRGKVLKDIANVTQGNPETIGLRGFGLEGDALAAVCGQYPTAAIKLHGVEDYQDVYVPGRLDLEVAAFKKMAAVHTRKNAPALFKAEGMGTGLEEAQAPDVMTSKERLKVLGEASPALFAEAITHAEILLKRTLQVGDGPSGRNLKMADHVEAPPKWNLINRVLDLIWPLENGPMHASKMKCARNIINQVIIYVFEGAQESRQRVKRQDGLITCDDDSDEQDFRFDPGMLSTILTYRHQINTLREAVKYVEKRKFAIEAAHSYPRPEHVIQRILRLDAKVFYPLLDWRRELEARLRLGDYRTSDAGVRRPTGGIYAVPGVPTMTKGLSQATIVARLVRAWRVFLKEGPKAPPNKGKPMKKTSARTKAPEPKTSNSSIKNSRLELRSGR
ncbi:hypothetical protein FLX27_11100 [Agrobacterium tumefaciens]|nr:hypothetical protein [Agrobacterium tumefaciens]TQN61471.1 hypothetical protein FLX27_11100 [Agrobacterium tumefaciens]